MEKKRQATMVAMPRCSAEPASMAAVSSPITWRADGHCHPGPWNRPGEAEQKWRFQGDFTEENGDFWDFTEENGDFMGL